jgi:hypothetical protein
MREASQPSPAGIVHLQMDLSHLILSRNEPQEERGSGRAIVEHGHLMADQALSAGGSRVRLVLEAIPLRPRLHVVAVAHLSGKGR